MLAVEFVKIVVVGRMVLRSVPPVPVAALGNQDFLKGEPLLSFAGAGRILGVELARVVQIVPSTVIFGSANPNVEVGMNPRARHQGLQRREVAMTGGRLRDRNRFETCLALDRVVESPQKFPPRL